MQFEIRLSRLSSRVCVIAAGAVTCFRSAELGKVDSHYRILLADDHPSFRHMLRLYLELNPKWEVCGEASDGLEAVARTAELHPDIVLMDLDMPNLDGFEATRRIHALSPSTRILILTFHEFSDLPQIA